MRRRLTVGVILSGGQAPGGHNAIAGLFDGLKQGNPNSRLFGFLDGLPGLIDNKTVEITTSFLEEYRNTGGFDMISSSRTKIETQEQFASSLRTAQALGLNAVVIMGGKDFNSNAALLAEYFAAHSTSSEGGGGGGAHTASSSTIQVIGVPKTIDGDLKNENVEASFGFDTAVKVYSNLIGNIARDSVSARKHWHFIKLMGRSASHITLECALQTQPNVCVISEEVEAKKLSLGQIVEQICHSVVTRAENKENFGVVLIPEGLVEHVPELKALFADLNEIMELNTAEFTQLGSIEEQIAWMSNKLSTSFQNFPWKDKGQSATVFDSLPTEIAKQLLMDRDPHGNVQVSHIATEKLLIGMVEKRLAELKAAGKYNASFTALGHFFGYEGRCACPSNFDANYSTSLGYTAFSLIASGFTGYLSVVRNLTSPPEQWVPGGVPFTKLMRKRPNRSYTDPEIQRALVRLDGAPFKTFEAMRAKWALETHYLYPGAIQYYGPAVVCDQATKTLQLEHKK